MPTRVYVVDDDSLVTTSLGTALRLETDWEVDTYNDASQALLDLDDAPPDVVLSDLKMPAMDGIDFLHRVRAHIPDAVLLLLTGYADKESAIRAINDVGLWQYVEKPWNTSDLILKVRQGLERRDLVRSLEVRNRELAARLSELETARERLVSSERLAAVGRVMAGLAHEMGNQLGLMGYAQLIVDKTDDAEVVEFAEAILRAQKRLGAMIGEIKDFVRGPDGQPGAAYPREAAELSAIVGEAVALVRFDRDAQARTVGLEVRSQPVVRLHRGKIMQAVINLVRNAVQATPTGGIVEVSVEETADRGALLLVVDHGAGMSPEVLARIGEPFFTTREGGTGLGLGITRRIIDEHGGTLRITSAPGSGTRVEVRLPPAESQVPAA